MAADDLPARAQPFAGSPHWFTGAVLLSYAALLAAVSFCLAPAAPPAIAAALFGTAAATCRLLHRRSMRRDQEVPASTARAASPAAERFRERPAFTVSRGAAIFCGVFSVSSSIGALLLDGGWTAPIAYGVTAAAASIVAFARRRRTSGATPS